ncbi:predicted protein [Histoplasma capsulatum H143]|uniref:Uncharacterized protein n=1 Tax=Ajellomyces capsulatus (strain H143) TaxID=544712 RepID=C6HTG8_AJECH|nr:predicted protein [Histoplasma capsulatum H143]
MTTNTKPSPSPTASLVITTNKRKPCINGEEMKLEEKKNYIYIYSKRFTPPSCWLGGATSSSLPCSRKARWVGIEQPTTPAVLSGGRLSPLGHWGQLFVGKEGGWVGNLLRVDKPARYLSGSKRTTPCVATRSLWYGWAGPLAGYSPPSPLPPFPPSPAHTYYRRKNEKVSIEDAEERVFELVFTGNTSF